MEKKQIAPDDVYEAMDLSEKLDKAVYKILKKTDAIIAINAIIETTIKGMIAQCQNYTQVLAMRHAFNNAFDRYINSLKVKPD